MPEIITFHSEMHSKLQMALLQKKFDEIQEVRSKEISDEQMEIHKCQSAIVSLMSALNKLSSKATEKGEKEISLETLQSQIEHFKNEYLPLIASHYNEGCFTEYDDPFAALEGSTTVSASDIRHINNSLQRHLDHEDLLLQELLLVMKQEFQKASHITDVTSAYAGEHDWIRTALAHMQQGH